MRDIILLVGFGIIMALTFRSSIVGLLAWIWVALMNPQREVFSFLKGAQLNIIIAVFTLGIFFASKERKKFPVNGVTVGLILFAAWTCLTTAFALDHSLADGPWQTVLKSIALALLAATMASNPTRIQAIVWAVVVSLAYFGIKGGGFVLLTGGHGHVNGPENSMISDNNDLGLALAALLPLINYLRASSKNVWVKIALIATMTLTAFAILGTYSRGALIALLVGGVAMALRSRSGVILVVVTAVLAAAAPAVLPHSWTQRMTTIGTYSDDTSFEGRVEAWRTTMKMIEARPLVGGGYDAIESDVVAKTYRTVRGLPEGRAAHSIYFQVLGDQGVIGFVIYISILIAAFFNTQSVIRSAAGNPEMRWMRDLALAMQVSFITYLVGGIALSMAYYDFFLVMLAMSAALLALARQSQTVEEGAKKRPAWTRLARTQAAVPAISSASPEAS